VHVLDHVETQPNFDPFFTEVTVEIKSCGVSASVAIEIEKEGRLRNVVTQKMIR
jgi:hypothetical protein